jgi:hypothetical protein
MAAIILADDGLAFDGRAADERPLGGAETAFADLAAALAARGHRVRAYARGARVLHHQGVAWAPVAGGLPATADLYIANRGHRVLGLCREARRVAFWVHNPARYLLKWRYQWPLLRRRPTLVFTGAYHAGTYPAWGMGGPRRIIPLGVSAPFPGTRRPPRRRRISAPARAGRTGGAVGRCDPAQVPAHLLVHAGGARRSRTAARIAPPCWSRCAPMPATGSNCAAAAQGAWPTCWRAAGSSSMAGRRTGLPRRSRGAGDGRAAVVGRVCRNGWRTGSPAVAARRRTAAACVC